MKPTYINPKNKELATLTKIRNIVECDILERVNEFLASGDWVLLHIKKTRSDRVMYVLGLLDKKDTTKADHHKRENNVENLSGEIRKKLLDLPIMENEKKAGESNVREI